MKLFSCFSTTQIEDESSNGGGGGHWRGCLHNQEPHVPSIPSMVRRQSSFESIRDVTSSKRPKIFPESHPQHRSRSRQNSQSQHSYKKSPSFPPNIPPVNLRNISRGSPRCFEPSLNIPDEDYFISINTNKNNNNHNVNMDTFLQELNQDMEFIENIARELMKAKRAIDNEIYQELQSKRRRH